MVTQNKKIRKFRNVVMTTAAVLAIGGAMANRIHQTATTYYVNGADWTSSSSFTVVASPQGSCGASGALACSVTANGSYSVGQSIPKSDIVSHTTRP